MAPPTGRIWPNGWASTDVFAVPAEAVAQSAVLAALLGYAAARRRGGVSR